MGWGGERMFEKEVTSQKVSGFLVTFFYCQGFFLPSLFGEKLILKTD